MAELEEIVRFESFEGVKHLQVDISPVLEDPVAAADAREYIFQMFEREVFDVVLAIESTGTYFASTVATRMCKPLVIAGEKDSMLREMHCEGYTTHHGPRFLRIPSGPFADGARVVIICDELTHGKDVNAAVDAVSRLGGRIVKIGVFVEHSDFGARRKLLRGIPLESRIITDDL